MLITKQDIGLSPTTYSEKLFASYLDENGYKDWLFEPQVGERRRHPDFVVKADDDRFVFDVKQREPKKSRTPPLSRIDPCKGIRKLIEKSRAKFEEFD